MEHDYNKELQEKLCKFVIAYNSDIFLQCPF